MANSITLVSQFVPMLDEVYKLASLTSDLDGAAELARQGANANELIIPKLDMNGLGDYSRNSMKIDDPARTMFLVGSVVFFSDNSAFQFDEPLHAVAFSLCNFLFGFPFTLN